MGEPIVAMTCTPDYPRPWVFPSLGMLTGRVVCLLDAKDRRPLPRGCERVAWQAKDCSFQDGRFLDALPNVKDDDVVVLADADGVFQRDWSDAEREVLDGLGDAFALGYNMRPGQRGAEEFEALKPRQSLEEAAGALGIPAKDLRGCLLYNTGLMAARASSWRRLTKAFAEAFGGRGAEFFAMHSWPQYFVCLALHRAGVPVVELGYETHSHGHFPLTPDHAARHRRLYYRGELVLFAHNISGVSH